MQFDVVIRGGRVVDGSGAPSRDADIGISGDRIAVIDRLPDSVGAAVTIDAAGCVVAPGFVDIHTHSDRSIVDHPPADSKLLQGVTTDVTGNCGFSPFPSLPGRTAEHDDLMAMLGPSGMSGGWPDLDSYAEAVAALPPAINIAPLVGHGALRAAVVGVDPGPLDGDDLHRIVDLLDEQLDQGAFGMSTGLTYVPSMYADASELRSLCALLAGRDRLYATHARYEAGCGLSPMADLIALAADSGVRAQFSHIALIEPSTFGRAGDACALFDDAAAAGVDVAFDVYPYEASASNLTQYLAAWITAGGVEAMQRRLDDVGARRAAIADVASGWFGGIPWNWDSVCVSRAAGIEAATLVGRSIAALADDWTIEPAAVVVELCLRYGNELQVVLISRRADDVATFLAHPLATLGSDGFALPLAVGADAPHPRSFGAHARVLGRYVGSPPALTLEDAVAKMSGRPAARVGLTDRGVLAPGNAADVVVFDAATVTDRATFEHPAQAPTGIRSVFVNGRLAVRDGVQLPERSGRVLRAAT